MFRVENADFIANKLASELLPDQEQREVYKNAEEAVQRRMRPTARRTAGIEFDVDWALAQADRRAGSLAAQTTAMECPV